MKLFCSSHSRTGSLSNTVKHGTSILTKNALAVPFLPHKTANRSIILHYILLKSSLHTFKKMGKFL